MIAIYTGDEILYGKKHAPLLFKAYDDLACEVNTKLQKRGIGRGFVCIQEAMNKAVFRSEQLVYRATMEKDRETRLGLIEEAESLLDADIWIAIRYLMNQKALTIGEIGVLTGKAYEIRDQYAKWRKKTETDKAVNG